MITTKQTPGFLEVTIPVTRGEQVQETFTLPAAAVLFDYSFDIQNMIVTIKFKL